jgi:DoxX-like protein
MSAPQRHLLRWSLVAVWWATALASMAEFHGMSRQLLVDAGLRDPVWIGILIAGGAAVDAAIGCALAIRPCRAVYAIALAAMVAMTAVATLLAPSLWLHPLGPLLKNLPIAAILLVLLQDGHPNATP